MVVDPTWRIVGKEDEEDRRGIFYIPPPPKKVKVKI